MLWLFPAVFAADPNEITVLGEAEETGAASSSLTRVLVDDLPPSAELADAVERSPGAVVHRLGGLGDWSAVSLRGSSLRAVEVLIDGVPLNPDGIEAVNLAELPLAAFERVDVYRGLAPPELGSSAMGGVINLITRSKGHSAHLAAGSWSTSRAAAYVAGERGLLAADAIATSGRYPYLSDGGTLFTAGDDSTQLRENNHKRHLSLHGRVYVPLGNARLSLSSAGLIRRTGVPGPTFASTEAVRYGVVRDLSVVQLDGRAGAWSGTARLWGQLGSQALNDPEGELGVGPQDLRDRALRVGMFTAGRQALGEHWVVGSALSARHERYRQLDATAPQGGLARYRWAGRGSVWGSWRPSEKVAVNGVAEGLVVDQRGFSDDGASPLAATEQVAVGLGAFLPRAGIRLRPRPWLSLRSNVGLTLRPPDLQELFGNAGDRIGRPDLRPERGRTVDLGLSVGDDRLFGEVVASWTSFRDGIVWVQNAQRVGVPVNLSASRVLGIEGVVVAPLGPHLGSRTVLTWLDARNLSEDPAYAGKQLPRIPTVEARQVLSLSVGRFHAGTVFGYTAGSSWDATNWYRSPPRPLVGLDGGYGHGNVELGLEVLNLLGTRTLAVPVDPLNPASSLRIQQALTDFAGYPLPGRTVMVSFRWMP